MKRSLQVKLILTYLAVALITVLVVSALIRLNSGQSLMNLVVEEQTARLKEAVQTYYTTNGTLNGFADYFFQLNMIAPGPDGGGPKPPDAGDIRGLGGLVDTEFRALLPTYGVDIGQFVPPDRIQQKIAVEVDGQTVAWILPDTKFQFKLNTEEQLFLERTNQAILLAALAGMLIAVGMGIFLARQLLKPIRRLTAASQALAHGNLEQQVPVTSHDELGQLTATFNQMSADLARADQQRKRMTADITHDLSTPLQVISGYIEMFEEGEVGLTPQRLEIIKTEIGHLRRLVGDLSTLSQVEGGGLEINLQPEDPRQLLERVYHAYQPIAAREGVMLTLDAPENLPPIRVDEGRMLQVIKNLVENALRYTPKGGQISLGAAGGENVELWVRDSGSGIDAEDLPYVFDRFYRADKARSGQSGKMGLGLAICKALMTAQGGLIRAESPGVGQGTAMIMTFEPDESPGARQDDTIRE
ncbi:MAG TPA: ATP-binding protein [Anaerolineaceae bacterium]|nr:ATP-binding protein [Anaerolineaceae bacterium]HPN52120.1 ATP-binding protein [Anaerolineaceae bacterium]